MFFQCPWMSFIWILLRLVWYFLGSIPSLKLTSPCHQDPAVPFMKKIILFDRRQRQKELGKFCFPCYLQPDTFRLKQQAYFFPCSSSKYDIKFVCQLELYRASWHYSSESLTASNTGISAIKLYVHFSKDPHLKLHYRKWAYRKNRTGAGHSKLTKLCNSTLKIQHKNLN